jgi:Fe-S-cluster containining protein
MAEVLRRDGYVSVVQVLVEMQRLTPARLEDWRFGRVPCLERVVQGSLGGLSAIGREIRRSALAQGLRPSFTVYRTWGRGPKRALRFSKSGEPSIEQAYATHWLSRRGRDSSAGAAATAESRDSSAATAATGETRNSSAAAAATGESRPADGGPTRTDASPAEPAAAPRNVLQPGVPIVRDPEQVRRLAAEKADENAGLRRFLKWGGPPAALVDRFFHRLNAEVSAEVDCTECGNCCRELSPVIRPKDIERLSRRLHVPSPEFRASHLREEDGAFVFARTPCPLLDANRCSVYRDRPKDCRSFPHLHKKEMTSRLLVVLQNAGICPIVFSVLERLKAELLERGHDWRSA